MYYRIARSSPPTRADFRPSCLEKPERYPREECLNCSTSIYDTPAAARRTADRYRGKLGNFIAGGRLAETDGKVHKTNADGHYEWWMPEGLDPTPSFTID